VTRPDDAPRPLPTTDSRPRPPALFSELELLLRLDWPTGEQATLVDVGAHIGRFSVAFAALGWRVIAFEPAPHIFSRLKTNLASYPDSVALQEAVSDATRADVDFFISDEFWGIHSLQPFHESHKRTTKVATTTLDAALDRLGVERVTVLKIDAEGGDLPALEGFDVSRWSPRLVMCEFMDSRSATYFGYDHHDVVGHMQGFGYEAFVSQWAPVEEHSREQGGGAPFTFLRFAPYPSRSAPDWGNLVFVSPADAVALDATALGLINEITAGRRDALVALDQRVAELDGAIVQRDRRIAELDGAIVQRDRRIASLTAAVVDRDRRIEGLDGRRSG
jgi:FkbM family methyltransferase